MFNLRPYQVQANAKVRHLEQLGPYAICKQGPTGSGKTVEMADLLLDPVPQIVFTHRRVLLDQLAEVLASYGVKFGIRAAGHPVTPDAPIQLSMAQSEWARSHRTERLPLHKAARVHWDEIHAQRGATTQEMMKAYTAIGANHICYTATPSEISHLVQDVIVSATVPELVQQGYLVPHWLFGPDVPDMEQLARVRRQANGEYSEKQLSKVFRVQAVFARIVEQWRRFNPQEKPTILFATSVGASVWLAQKLTATGIPAAHIDGENVWMNGVFCRSDTEARERVREALRAGTIKIVCNRYVLREGVDWPFIECAVLATCFGTRSAYVQSAGRVLRLSPGKERAIIIDHGGNWLTHPMLDSDEPWDFKGSERQLAKDRVDRLRDQKEPEPITCPECATVRLVGDECPNCGHRSVTHARWVLQVSGDLQLVRGRAYQKKRPAPKKRKSDADVWAGLFWGNRKYHPMRTPAQIRGYYGKVKGKWLPKTLPLMPRLEADWDRPIGELDFKSLIREGEMSKSNPPTEKQAKLLERYEYDPSDHTFESASALIDKIAAAGWKRPDGKGTPAQSEKKSGGCTAKQANLLGRYGLPTDVPFEKATKWIDAIAENGWKVPEDLEHLVVEDSGVPSFAD